MRWFRRSRHLVHQLSTSPATRRGFAMLVFPRSLAAAAPLARALVGALDLHLGLHLGLGELLRLALGPRPRAGALVGLEPDGRVDLELHRRQHLLHLGAEVRVLEELA